MNTIKTFDNGYSVGLSLEQEGEKGNRKVDHAVYELLSPTGSRVSYYSIPAGDVYKRTRNHLGGFNTNTSNHHDDILEALEDSAKSHARIVAMLD